MSSAHVMPGAQDVRPGISSVSRRGLLGAGAAVAAGALAGGAVAGAPAAAVHGGLVRPPALRPGDRVRVVAPARTPDTRLNRGIEILRSFGLVVEVATHVTDVYGYFAGTDTDRLADLRAAFADRGIRGVFAARGGYGTQRIIDGLDLRLLRADPKVFVGFSDLTTLHLHLQRAGVVSWYGPMINWSDARTGADSIESLRKAIMTTEPVVLTPDPAEPSAAVTVPGRATGLLFGGNLTMLDTGVGARDFPDLSRAILLFEDVDEPAYSYDRMLTHLLRAGVLSRVAGVAIGQVTNAGTPAAGEWDAATAIRDRLAGLGVPVLGGLRLGHGNGQLTVPLGVPATIDTHRGTLTVEAGVRAADGAAPQMSTLDSPVPQLPLAPADPRSHEW